MNKFTKSGIKLFDVIAILFSIFWIVVLFIDYLNKHPVYFDSFQYLRYTGLIIFYAIFGGFLIWLMRPDSILNKKKKRNLLIPFSLIVFPISIIALVMSYSEFYETEITFEDYFFLMSKSVIVISSAFIVLFSCYCIGAQISNRFLVKKVFLKSHFTIELVLGITIFTFLLFLLAAFQMLNMITCGVLLALSIGLNYKNVPTSFKNIWNFNPDYNNLQLALLYITAIFCVFNFVFILGPYPLGFDSRNYYLNIPQLIAENGGLVSGFQPYNWELFMSIGLVLFKKIEVSMFISQLGGILAAFSAYHISKSIVKLDKTQALLIGLILIVTPAISRQMFIELKVDLALLFFQLVTIQIFISHILFKNKSKNSYVIFAIVIGALFGFALGIKLLNFFLMFGIFAVIALDRKNLYGLGFVLLFGLGAIFFLKLDEQTGLRYYHKNVDSLSYFLLLVGLISAGMYLYKDRAKAMKSIFQMAIISAIALFTFSPWIIKAYTDTGSTKVMRLIRGGSAGHDLDQGKLTDLYNKMVIDEE